MVLGLAAAMAVCALLCVPYELFGPSPDADGSLSAMAISAVITAGLGALLWRWGLPAKGMKLRRIEATITTTAVWGLTGVCGAIPLMVGAGTSPADAIFEACSGFTTTGATILTEIEALSRPLLLWRSLMQWLGGMGIVVLFVAIFPSLGVSGKHMFRTEVPGHSAEGLKPKITETSTVLWRLYAAITGILVAVLFVLFTWFVPKTANVHWSDNLFDAVCHAMTTLSTGGFSTKNASIAFFDSAAVDVTLSIFMLIAGVNFGLYYGALLARSRRLSNPGLLARMRHSIEDGGRVFVRSVEFRAYCGLVAVVTILLTIAILPNHDYSWSESLRYALFMVSTTITSTGFGTDDYMAYAPTGLGLVLAMMFVGGMSGSTAGGIKISRVVLLLENTWGQLRKSVRPAVVQVTRLGREIVSEDTLNAVATFFFIYMVCLGAGTILVTYTDGVPVQTAFGATLTSLSNMGPGPFYEGSDNFARYSPTAKLVFSFAMILGRLEFFTVFALLLPDVWKR